MRYGIKGRLMSGLFLHLLRSYYRRHQLMVDLAGPFKDLRREFKAMVERTPGIGGKSLEDDLLGACFFFAMAKTIPGMTPDLMDKIVAEAVRSDVMQRAHARQRRNGTLFSDKVQDTKAREAELSHASPYQMDWEFTYRKGTDEFWCTYTQCGICKLAKREGMERYLPCMCRMDFATYEMVGARLERTKTLARGDECCDFHVTRIGSLPGDPLDSDRYPPKAMRKAAKDTLTSRRRTRRDPE